MKGTTFLVLSAVVLVMLCACLWQYIRVRKGYRSKPYNLLLLMLFKIDMALAHGMEYIRLALDRVFKGYHYSAVRADRVRWKEERLDSYRKQLREASEGYRRRENYKRKILQ